MKLKFTSCELGNFSVIENKDKISELLNSEN